MSKELLRNTIQEMWEIREAYSSELRNAGYHFVLVCTNAFGDETLFECRTIDEAETKLNAIAQEYDRKRHVLGDCLMASDLEQLLRLGVISPDVFAKYMGHLTQAAQAQGSAGQQATPPASTGPAAMAPGPTAPPQGQPMQTPPAPQLLYPGINFRRPTSPQNPDTGLQVPTNIGIRG